MTSEQIETIKDMIHQLNAIGRMDDMNFQDTRETLGMIEYQLERMLPEPFVIDENVIRELMGDEYDDFEDDDDDPIENLYSDSDDPREI